MILPNSPQDDDRPYLWNGENYLIKMLHDLDPLDQIKVIRKWADFSLMRNPFCVPYPLELGTQLFTSTVMNPSTAVTSSAKSLQPSAASASANMIDGFVIGGGSQSLGKPHLSKMKQALVSSSVHESTKDSPYRWDPVSRTFETASALSASALVPVGVVQSFVSNQDMQRIRAAEGVILQAERAYLDSLPMITQEDGEQLSLEEEQDGEQTSALEGRELKRDHTNKKKVALPFFPALLIHSQTHSSTATANRKTPSVEEDPHHSSRPLRKGYKKSVRDRLAEISALKEKIEKEKALLAISEAAQPRAPPQPWASRQSAKRAESLRQEVRGGALVEAPAEEEAEEEQEQEEDLSEGEEAKDHESSTHLLSATEDGGSLDDDSDMFQQMPPVLSPSPPSAAPAEGPKSSSSPSLGNLLKSSNSFKEKAGRKPTPKQRGHKSGSKKLKQAALEKAAVRIQATVRGWRMMRYARAFRQQAIVSSTLLQKIVRGFCARVRVKAALLRKRASTLIQKRTRGMITRVRPSSLFSSRPHHLTLPPPFRT
jgi:hypothetical protein